MQFLLEDLLIANPTAYFVQLSQTNPQAAVAAAQNEKDIARILASPVMVEHPYGKFGPTPREAATVARAMMDHFRASEIKWSPSETSMLSLLELVQRIEDRCVYSQYVDWIKINRQHRERADFLESVLSHIREDAPTKEDLEKQYHALLETKPLPPRQPYILPASEMRLIVFAAYTLTAQEKRTQAKAAAVAASKGETNNNNNNGDQGGENQNNNNSATSGATPPSSLLYAFKIGADGKPNPVYLESNLKSHLARAVELFPELHGNIRPFMLEALKE